MRPKISVIVPVYNSEKYLKRCIDSIINQTLTDIEIILINDGSSDNSGKIIDEYAKKDNRIVAIHQENSGPSVTRNKGIKTAKGKYIGFVDSDDYIESSMYEKLYNLVYEKNIQVGMCAYVEKYVHSNTEQIVNTKLINEKVYNKSEIKNSIISTFTDNENYGFYSLCNKIYLREWIIDLEIYIDESRDHGEDWWFNICLFTKIESYIYTKEIMYNYIHINKNSLMFKYRENQFDLFLDGRLKLISILNEYSINYNKLNKRFIFEISTYILNTIKYVDDYEKQKKLINKVVNNIEVIRCCKDDLDIGYRYKFVQFLIRNNLKSMLYCFYKIASKVR